MEDNMLYTIKEVMKYLKVSRSTIYRLILRNMLHVYRVGRGLRFYGADVKKICCADTVVDEQERAS